jgi:hypothetical protein
MMTDPYRLERIGRNIVRTDATSDITGFNFLLEEMVGLYGSNLSNAKMLLQITHDDFFEIPSAGNYSRLVAAMAHWQNIKLSKRVQSDD